MEEKLTLLIEPSHHIEDTFHIPQADKATLLLQNIQLTYKACVHHIVQYEQKVSVSHNVTFQWLMHIQHETHMQADTHVHTQVYTHT